MLLQTSIPTIQRNVDILDAPIWGVLWYQHKERKADMTIQSTPPALAQIIRAIESRHNVSLAK